MTLRIGSLFSGYGGLDIAVQSVLGGDLAWYSEIEPAACRVLAAHHPGVPNLGDITAVDWADVEPVDVLTGGYPCQPFSHAGKRKGTNDERHLWPYVRDAIRVLRPRITVLENVRGHLTLGFDTVLADLAELGLSARWGVVRAADAGAPHGRARLFIVVTPDADGSRWPEDVIQPGDFGPQAGEGQPSLTDRHRSDGDAATGSGALAAADPGGEGSQGTDALQDGRVGTRGPVGVSPVAGIGAAADADDARQQDGAITGRTQHHPAEPNRDIAADALGQRHDGRGAERAEERPGSRRANAARSAASATDADGAGSTARGHAGRDGERVRVEPVGPADTATDWGKYAPAIHRWERVLGRPAPAPTVPGRNGRPRLNPVLVEWMMGLPAGHVTGHGLSAAQELKMLGNGVVPQQASLALRMLLGEQVAA